MRRAAARRARLQTAAPEVARVESLSHDGRGIARVDGKVVFVDGALPGEEIVLVYTALRRDYSEARLERIITPSPDRVEPRCSAYHACGGCRLQHLDQAAQLALKQNELLEQMRRIGKVEPETILDPLAAQAFAYRRKARLGVKYVAKKGKVLVGFREKASSLITEVESCPVLHPAVGERIAALAELVESLDTRDRVPQIEVAIGDEDVVLVFRFLAEPTREDLLRLDEFGRLHRIAICLQREGPDSVRTLDGRPPPLLHYSLPDQDLRLAFAPGEFTQVNLQINRLLIGRVIELLDLAPEHAALDLFCGLGNFSLPIAQRASHVLGVEGDDALVSRARDNAAANGIANAEFLRADLFASQHGATTIDRPFDRVLLDPPRSGALEVLALAPRWGAPRIVYVSCNPATLARDAGFLVQLGYRLDSAGVLDMFPQTAHVESLAVFTRR
ncbi:MAG: 23S rRNA (uracil(1939)-C(5))-methyltransferase RlmD [Methylotetracoccus sp.]